MAVTILIDTNVLLGKVNYGIPSLNLSNCLLYEQNY